MPHFAGKIEDFITLVQNRPPLYNYTLDEFNNKRLTEKLWKEVAHEMNTTVNYCKTKWGVLRVSFARQMRNEKINATKPSGHLKNDWYLKDNMGFMRNFMRKRRRSSDNIAIQTSNNDILSTAILNAKEEIGILNSQLEIKNEPVVEDEGVSLTSLETVCDEDYVWKPESEFISRQSSSFSISRRNPQDEEEHEPPSKKKSKKIEDDAFVFTSPKITNHQQEETLTVAPVGANLTNYVNVTFFKSILPEINKLTERRQRVLKQKVIQELYSLLDEQESET